jgi:hypothetical protein
MEKFSGQKSILFRLETILNWRKENDNIEYEYKYFFGGSAFKEDQFKQKLILLLKSMKSISAVQAIPEAVNIIVQGLKEGAELKGFANFELGDNSIVVKAKKKSIQDGNPET